MTMIKNTRYKIVLLAGIFLLPGALAQDINVDFVATIKGTTCNITLEGTRVTADGNNQYTLRILNVALDKIINKMPEAHVTWYKPTLFVHQTGQACAMNTIGLYGEHGKLVQPRNNDFPCQSIQNLDTSSVGSCSKFHEILYQVLPLHPASFPFGGEG